jgi:glycine betaine/choline ABC-type transport system substrate-binding protein
MIAALGLVVLEDDKNYFPPYDAVPIVRPQALQGIHGVQSALDQLSGRITTDDMRNMNFAVDGKRQNVSEVVRNFIASRLGAASSLPR